MSLRRTPSISTQEVNTLRREEVLQQPSSPSKKKAKSKKTPNMCLAVQSLHIEQQNNENSTDMSNDSRWDAVLLHEFEVLRSMVHDGLCEQVDLIKSSTGSDLHFLISIQYKTTLRDEIDFCKKQNKRVNDDRVYKVFAQLWNALHVLHSHGVHVGYLTPESLCLDNLANVKIGHYGLYHLYKFVKPRVAVIGAPPYLAPELYASLKWGMVKQNKPNDNKENGSDELNEDVWFRINSECDVWTVAVILLEYILSSKMPISFTSSMENGDQVYHDLMNFVKYCGERRTKATQTNVTSENPPREEISKEYIQAYERLSRIDNSVSDIILSCLTLLPVHRPSIEWIMQHEFFSSISREKPTHILFNYIPVPLVKCNEMTKNSAPNSAATANDGTMKSYETTVTSPGTLHSRSRSNSIDSSSSIKEVLSKRPEAIMVASYRAWRDYSNHIGKPICRFFESRREIVFAPRAYRTSTIVTTRNGHPVIIKEEGTKLKWLDQRNIRHQRTLTIASNVIQEWMESNGQSAVNVPPSAHTDTQTACVAEPPFVITCSTITDGMQDLKSASKYEDDEQIEDILSEDAGRTKEASNAEGSDGIGLRMLSNTKYSSLVHVTGDLHRKRTHSTRHNTPYPWTSFDNLLSKNDKNADYQKGRVALFRRLLMDYPNTRYEIIREAKADIPGVLRGEIWAAILGIEHDLDALAIYNGLLHKINTMRRNGRWLSSECEASDRQIAVDVPRCHQYNKLLASKTGHAKLTRVLRAWVVYHDTTAPSPASVFHATQQQEDENHPKRAEGPLVYWQGLDSLTAPFVVLNFHFEARAFCCLRTLVDKYVKGFFSRDNSHAMEERLITFQKLLIYHDPELGLHLRNIGFSPELYAIPWFLTLFAHVLPIEKIFKLWDALLLSSSSHHLPIFLAIGMIRQLRSNLLHSDFNSSMTLFQNMQGIDIRRAIKDADHIVERTPRSLLSLPRTMTLQQYNDKLCARLNGREFEQSLSKLALVIDVRKYSDFEANHYNMAHHVTSFLEDEVRNQRAGLKDVIIEQEKTQTAIEEAVVSAVKCKQGLPIVLIGKDDCKEACKQIERMEKLLVLEQVPYVSVLDGGMEAMKQLSVQQQ